MVNHLDCKRMISYLVGREWCILIHFSAATQVFPISYFYLFSKFFPNNMFCSTIKQLVRKLGSSRKFSQQVIAKVDSSHVWREVGRLPHSQLGTIGVDLAPTLVTSTWRFCRTRCRSAAQQYQQEENFKWMYTKVIVTELKSECHR
jgi:hypothetical protein